MLRGTLLARDGTPVAPSESRQLFGSSTPASGPGWDGTASTISAEAARMANLFGWDNNGPPVHRIFGTNNTPPWGDLATIVNDGRVAWISLKPTTGGNPGNDANGTHDGRWTGWGDYLKDFWPQPIIFTYDHEHDRHNYGGANTVDNAGWRDYQMDVREAYVRIKGLITAADTMNGNSHVIFAGNVTGWAMRTAANRDIGLAWHPDIDMWTVDPYYAWRRNDGSLYQNGKTHFWSELGSDDPAGDQAGNGGAFVFYQWGMDPLDWYEDWRPEWLGPASGSEYKLANQTHHVLANLDKFPTRVAVGETGTQFDMQRNSESDPTAWVPLPGIDVEDPDTWLPSWLRQAATDLRTNCPRYEAFCYWHSAVAPITADTNNTYYFAGPAANRWGAEWPSAISAMQDIASDPAHVGTLTPWTPSGLA